MMNEGRAAEALSQPEPKTAKVFLSVILPAYNEAQNLRRTLKELEEVVSRTPSVEDYEVLIIDDHSNDGTLESLRSLGLPRLRCLRLSRRSGSHIALRAGLAHARGEVVLCLAADGQDDPHVLGEMIRQLQAGSHVVWAIRRSREESFIEKCLSAWAYGLIRFFVNAETDKEIEKVNLSHADFFMFSRKFADAVNRCEERRTSLFGLIVWLGFKQSVVWYERRQRRGGRSKWNFRSKFRLLADWIIAFSAVPLKLILFIGLLMAALGFLYAFCIIVMRFLGHTLPGWTETVLLILILGGTQMLMLGITGEYLWRNFDETRKRPLYFIEQELERDIN